VTEMDLFWQPRRGDKVLIKPGSHGWHGALPAEREHGLRVTSEPTEMDGQVVMFCCALGPVRQRTTQRGRVITEEPSTQSVFVTADLMPA